VGRKGFLVHETSRSLFCKGLTNQICENGIFRPLDLALRGKAGYLDYSSLQLADARPLLESQTALQKYVEKSP